MPSEPKREPKLSLGYRFWYHVRYALWGVLGPAQLEGHDDPHERLRRERAAKEAALRQRGHD